MKKVYFASEYYFYGFIYSINKVYLCSAAK